MIILGMDKEIYTREEHFEDEVQFNEKTRHIIYAKQNDQKLKIVLEDEDGMCYSGWTYASYASMDIYEIDEFPKYKFKIKKLTEVDDLDYKNEEAFTFNEDENSFSIGAFNNITSYKNDVFDVDCDGDDMYYPDGEYNVNEDLFEIIV